MGSIYRRDKSPTSTGSEGVSYSSRRQNNQCRRNRAYPCVTHALGDHETQLPDSSPTPNSFQHQASANHSPSGPHRCHGTPSNLPKSVTHPLASELVYKRFHCGRFHTCHVRRFSCEPRRRMKLATEGTRQWQPTKRTINLFWALL